MAARHKAKTLTHVEMCERCAKRCWPHLQAPALVEQVLLEQVAKVLESCDTCVSQAGKLRNAAQRTIGDHFWAWVDG
jgi:hypothetical protein